VLFKEDAEDQQKRIGFKGSEALTLLLDIFIEEMKRQYEERM